MNCVDFYDADGVLQVVAVPNVTHLTEVNPQETDIHLSSGKVIKVKKGRHAVIDAFGLTGRRGGALWPPPPPEPGPADEYDGGDAE